MPKIISILTLCLLALTPAVIAHGNASSVTAAENTGRPINLTPSENTWIAQHNPIRVGMSPVVPPLKFIEEGIIKGIEPDYLKLLSSYTGLEFEIVEADFSVLDEKVKAAEVDMFISFNIPERLQYMTFTEPLMEVKQLIVARNESPFISGIGSLKGKRVATVKGVRLNDKLFAPYPDIQRVPVDTVEQQFHAVAESKADALIVRTYSVGYLINKYPELKVVGFVEQPPEPFLYAVRKDYAPLVGILNKAIKAIPSEQHDAIMQKWCSVRIEPQSIWLHLRKWVFMLGGGFSTIIGLTIFWNRKLVREIDRRKVAEENLRSTNEYLEKLINHTNAPIIVWDANLCITRFNHAFEKLTGRNEPDALGESVKIIFPADLAAVSMESIKKASTGESMEAVEILVQHLDGSLRTVLWNSAAIYAPDGQTPIATIAQGHDITTRKQVEDEKLALEHQLQETMRWESIGLLAGGIAHDFNNILAVIIGHCGILHLHPERIDKSLPEIEKAAERAADLCQQMLAYAGKAPALISRIDMAELVTDIVRMLQPNLPKNVSISTSVSRDICQFEADASQIRQVVMNLLMNAVEAIGEAEGKIHIALDQRKISASETIKSYSGNTVPAGQYLCLEVADNGCGISEDIKSKIFEPFYTTKFFGRGLGMSAALGIITAHQGTIQLESAPGKGTVFTIYLPVLESESAVHSKTPEEPANLWQGQGTILLVEDEEAMQEIAKAMLEMLGFTVITTANGLEALTYYRENKSAISLVLTDIEMPVMDGSQLIHELQKLDIQLPIIISSGFGDDDVTLRTASAEVAGMLSKPYNFSQLQEVLKKVCNG